MHHEDTAILGNIGKLMLMGVGVMLALILVASVIA